MSTSPPALPSRGRTYAFLCGVVATSLVLAVGLPLVLGERPETAASNDTLAFDDGSGSATATDPGPLPDGSFPAAELPVPQQAVPGAAAPGALPDAAAGAGPGAVPGAGQPGAAQPGAGQPGAGPAGPGAAGAPGAPAGPAGTPATRPGTAPAARTASDQGITADTVRVGVFLIDFSEAVRLGAGGAVAGYDPAEQKAGWDAHAAEVNATGGLNGRRMVPVFRTVDILDQQSMRDACTSFGQSDKVFAVVQVLGVYGDPILKCAQEQRLPFLATDGAASGYYSASKGYVITTQPSTLRTNANLARELVRTGELRGKKVGVLYYDGYLLPDNQRLLAQLRADGVDVVEGRLSVDDVGRALRELPVLANNFCRAGTEVVLLGTNALYGRQFVQNVDRNPGCAPAYAVSDFDFALAGDSFVRDMPASFFRRGLAVTASRHGEGRVGQPEPARDAACRAVAERRTGRRLDRSSTADNSYFNALSMCQVLGVLRDGLTRAGANPTRDSFVAGVQAIGAFENAGYGPSSFRPGRTDSTDAVRISQAFGDCKCWKPVTGFVAAPFR